MRHCDYIANCDVIERSLVSFSPSVLSPSAKFDFIFFSKLGQHLFLTQFELLLQYFFVTFTQICIHLYGRPFSVLFGHLPDCHINSLGVLFIVEEDLHNRCLPLSLYLSLASLVYCLFTLDMCEVVILWRRIFGVSQQQVFSFI